MGMRAFPSTVYGGSTPKGGWGELHPPRPVFGAPPSERKSAHLPRKRRRGLATSNNANNDDERGTERGVVTKARPKTKKPSQYRVLLLNDDYTPMEFVVGLLMGVFKKTQEEATKIMLDVHQNGIGVCGIYTFEVAETKVVQVLDAAKRHDHPLKCTLEKA